MLVVRIMDIRAKILYVEDNAVFSQALVHRLSGEFNFVCVGSLREATTVLHQEDFIGCLLDLNLPDITGIATLRAFKNLSTIPVIVVSGINDDQLYVKSIWEGAKEFFSKDGLVTGPGAARLDKSINRCFVRASEPTSYAEIATLCDSINHRMALCPQ